MFFLIISLIAAISYFILQAFYLHHWKKLPSISVPDTFIPQQGITVILVAKNEEKTIESCIQSILRQTYPPGLFELIIIDDRSTDTTAEIVEKINHPSIRFFKLGDNPSFIHPPAYKKSGIELGVHLSKFELIAVTDADCQHHSDWLRSIAFVMETQQCQFITGPALIHNENHLLIKMQLLENLTLMLITGAGIQSNLHTLANGANMAFRKTAFNSVNGFEGNHEYASGDDMLLAEKMSMHFKNQTRFLKSANVVVNTHGKYTWSSLIKQRIRWAEKNKGLKNKRISTIWLFVGFYHVMIVMCLIASLFFTQFIFITLMVLIVKWSADYMLVRQASKFFMVQIPVADFIKLQFMYTYYLIRLGGSLLLGGRSDWK